MSVHYGLRRGFRPSREVQLAVRPRGRSRTYPPSDVNLVSEFDVLICGVKLTHDGGIAVVEDGKLRFQIDTEKVGNNSRFASGGFDALVALLDQEGVALNDLDAVVVDGWHPPSVGVKGEVRTTVHGAWRRLPVAGYAEPAEDSLLRGLSVVSRHLAYTSYPHACSHVMAGYCTSPFAALGEDSFVLVWDGGMRPHLYFWSAREGSPLSLGPILPVLGSVYADFAVYFEPFLGEWRPNRWPSVPELDRVAMLSCAGKVMAYSALGEIDVDLSQRFARCLEEAAGTSDEVLLALVQTGRSYGGTSQDLLATFQAYLGAALVDAVRRRVEASHHSSQNLCFVGGCALNVIWNRLLRDEAGFDHVWIPPFPNDSGSALGAACAEMVARGGAPGLQWNVYSGPRLGPPPEGGRACSTLELADLLHTSSEPVVVLHGRAELGPRALGNRSILAACTNPAMQQRLNTIKGREPYRPIAPICLEEHAPAIFDPGSHDPYMLFAHTIRPAWRSRIPAVAHVDGSARLQTVADRDNPVLAEILRAYEARSGVPVLCNTSANKNGSGFFPDADSALRWGRVKHVWAEGRLYESSQMAGAN